MKKLCTLLAGLCFSQLTVQAQSQSEILKQFRQERKAKAGELRKIMISNALKGNEGVAQRNTSNNTRLIGTSSYSLSGPTGQKQDSTFLSYANSALASYVDYYFSVGYNFATYQSPTLGMVFPFNEGENVEYSVCDYYMVGRSGTDSLVAKRERTYNSNNQMLQHQTSGNQGAGFVPVARTVNTYDPASGRVRNLYEIMLNGSISDTVIKTTYQYSAAGVYEEDESLIKFMGLDISVKTDLFWTGSRLDSIMFYLKLDPSDPWMLVEKTSATYAGNNVTSILSQEHDGVQYVNSERIDFTYNTANQVTSKSDFVFDANQWIRNQSLTYTYNSNGNPEKVAVYLHNGGTPVDLFLGFSFNSNNLPVKLIETYDPTLADPYRELNFYYETITSIDELSGKARSLQVYPNPVSHVLNIDEHADYRSYQIMNLAGQLLESGSLNSQINKLDVNHIPAGNYVIQLVDNKGQRYAAPFVKY